MSAYAGPEIVNPGLVLHLDVGNVRSYPGSGTTWFDISGNRNNFTLFNSPTFSSDNGGSLTFNGTNQYARSTNTINFNAFDYIVVDVFVKVNNTSAVGIVWEITTNSATDSSGLVYATNTDGFNNVLNTHHSIGPGIVPRNVNFSSGSNWANHVNIYSKIVDSTGRLTYGNASLLSYVISGAASATGTSTSSSSFANDFMYVASRAGTSNFNPCSISTIKVYGIKLSAAEIRQNFNALRGRFGI